jgi:dTMP kinase
MYVILEGPDASGKDTQAELLAENLTYEGFDPLLISESVTDTPPGKLLRQFLIHGEHKAACIGLMLAERMILQEETIKPALAAGRPVISVRSFLSSVVYQNPPYSTDWLYTVHQVLPCKPTHVILLDIEPEEVRHRLALGQGEFPFLENIKSIRQRYLDLMEDKRFWASLAPGGKAKVFQAPTGDPEESKKVIQEAIQDFIGLYGEEGNDE